MKTVARGFWRTDEGQAIIKRINAAPVKTVAARAEAAKLGVLQSGVEQAAERWRNKRVGPARSPRRRPPVNGIAPTVTLAPIGRGEFLLTVHDGKKTLL